MKWGGHAHSLVKSLPHSELRYLSIGLNCVNFIIFFAFNSQCSETVIQKSWTITYDTSFNREKNACPEHFRNDSQSCLTVFLCHRKTVQLCSVAGKVHSEKVDKSKNKFSTATFKFWFQIEMITHSGGFWLADPSSGGLRLADPSFLHHALCVQLQFGCTESFCDSEKFCGWKAVFSPLSCCSDKNSAV